MIVYEADKKQFLHQTDHHDIEEIILANFKASTGKGVNASEKRSWRESLSPHPLPHGLGFEAAGVQVAKVLRDEDIPNEMGVAVELHIPQSSKRIDVTLTGRDDSAALNVARR